MKRLYPIVLAGLMLMLAGCHKDLWNSINDLQSRVEKLEVLCAQMNTNIDALQTIINAIQTNDMITNVAEVKEGNIVIGYSITFLSGKTITIHNGKDGVDGQDGQDGKDGTNGSDGYTPLIGVDQDSDGTYYWTLDGDWLLDADGNKLPVTGAQGEKGEKGDQGEQGEKGDPGTDGEDGEKGDTGANGNDGITPQLKIDSDYWYISYDNGVSWTQLGKATGEKGDKGDTGATGEKGDKGDKGDQGEKGDTGDTGAIGDSIFRSVTSDDNYVYFTLRTGKVYRVPTGNASTSSRFTIVYNLNEGLGTFATDSFPYSQATTIRKCTYLRARYAFAGWNTKSNGSGLDYEAGTTFTVTQNITLYAKWNLTEDFSVGGGKKVKFAPGNLQYQARRRTWRFAENQYDYIGEGNNNTSTTYAGWIDLFGWGTADNPTNTSSTNSDYSFTDWGKNVIDDYPANTWRTLTRDEWYHLYAERTNASSLHGHATVNGIYGLVFLPDTWNKPSGISFNAGATDYSSNKYTLEQWAKMEAAGAVFLPAAGVRQGSTFFMVMWYGYYWSSSEVYYSSTAWYDREGDSHENYAEYFYWRDKSDGKIEIIARSYGCSVRLVHDL